MGPSLLLAEGYKKIPCPPERATGEYLFSDMLSAGRAAHNQSGGAGRSQMCRAVGEESACGFERGKIGFGVPKIRCIALGRLPAQIEHIGIVTCSLALADRPFSFSEPDTGATRWRVGGCSHLEHLFAFVSPD
jgi:hypothetical protein